MIELPSLRPFDVGSVARSHLRDEVGGPALARVAQRFARSIAIASPWAPGLVCVGGEIAPDPRTDAAPAARRFSVTGTGLTLVRAVTACLGEAADLMSHDERPGDVAARGHPDEIEIAIWDGWVASAGGTPGPCIDWVVARQAKSGAASRLPADLCLRREPRRRALEPVGPLSAGVAAGPTLAAATLRAVLELCERDAVALWWQGGRRARSFPKGHPADSAAGALIERLRGGERGRSTTVLDISTDLSVPVVAAVSLDRAGRGLACGAASRLDPAEAAEAAVLELCQMEMSAPLAHAKLAQAGEAALNDDDRRHLRRAAWQAADCALLRPDCMSDLDAIAPTAGPADTLVEWLARRGIVTHVVDLTRADIGVPVARALAPLLQPFSTAVSTPRLVAAQARAGASLSAPDIPLF